MKRPSVKWLAVAAAGCIFASSMGTYTYTALADEFVYTDANVSITSIVDHYIEENGGDVFTADATPEDATAPAAVVAEATATDAVATGEIQEIAKVTGEIAEVPSEETTEAPATEEPTTEAPVQEASEAAASPVMDFTGKAIVTASGSVNIRQSGDVNAAKVGTIDAGGLVNIVEKGDTWSHITSGNVDGYIRNDLLAFEGDAASYASANLSKVAVVNTAALKLRSAASTDSESITLLAQGESYPIVETGDAWTKIQLDTVTGYVKNEYITISYNMPTAKAVSAPAQDTTTTEAPTTEAPTTEAPTTEAPVTEAPTSDLGQQIANFACQFVGNPYVWGGTSLTNGADCSGFVLSVFRNYGISLPHSSRAQANCGTKISLSELKPGDLVFYGNRSGINHVAIYVGGGQVVHASNPRVGITISGVSYRSPVKAVRVIKD